MSILIGGDMEYPDLVGLTEILGWKDISTKRQKKNGTTIYRLPIKKYGQYIEFGSFESGYVRRMNGCYTPYQLNKTEDYDHFYKAYEWQTKGIGDNCKQEQVWTGKYNKHVCRRRVKIDTKEERLEHLITYCLKNYYINQANMIENGKFIPKWKHEYEMKNGDIERVRELQSENRRLHNIYLKQTQEIRELKEKYEETAMELSDTKLDVPEVKVIINGTRYNLT